MLRRITMLATLVLALTAAPAFASTYTLHTQMASGVDTSSRQSGGCHISPGSHGSLVVACRGHEKATLTYTFSSGRRPVHGRPMGWAWYSRSWYTTVGVSTKATGRTIRVTVTVSGGTATVDSVCVSYYS